MIAFTCDGAQHVSCLVRVTHVHHHASFADWLRREGSHALGASRSTGILPGIDTLDLQIAVYQGFSPDEEAQQVYGILVFHFECIDPPQPVDLPLVEKPLSALAGTFNHLSSRLPSVEWFGRSPAPSASDVASTQSGLDLPRNALDMSIQSMDADLPEQLPSYGSPYLWTGAHHSTPS